MINICFIAQFPPPIHGLSKAVETLYNSNLNCGVASDGEFQFEKVDITDNRYFIKNLLKIYRSKADLFYFTISQTKGGNLRDLIILKVLKMQKKKCLVHLHGGYYRRLIDENLSNWQRRLNYRVISKLEGVIVLSKSLKSNFEGMIDNDRIYVVENCIDDQYLLTEQGIAEKLKTFRNENVIHVLWLSNFIRSKGYPFVLELAKVEKEHVEEGGERRFHFDFAGKFFNEDEKNYFKNIVNKNRLNNYVTYYGIVEGETKRELLKKSHIFILPTRYPNEGQPISILEAMGNGMFIVTTDHAGIPDIVEDGENGIIMDKTVTPNEIYSTLCQLQKDTLRKVGLSNFKKVKDQFSEREYLKHMKEVYTNVVKNSGGG